VTNPFLVPCPPAGGCGVPAGTRCRIGNPRIDNETGDAVHAARRDAARIRTATHGTCTLCGRLMLQMTDPDQTRHAVADDAGPIPMCPPISTEPGIREYTPSGAAQFTRSPVQPAQPVDQPNPPPPTTYDPLPAICPECVQGKHRNCDGQAWDPVADEPTTCGCTAEDHDGQV
jgi:hypothetical protein